MATGFGSSPQVVKRAHDFDGRPCGNVPRTADSYTPPSPEVKPFVHRQTLINTSFNRESKQIHPHSSLLTYFPVSGYFLSQSFLFSTGLPTGCAHHARRFAQSMHRVIHRGICAGGCWLIVWGSAGSYRRERPRFRPPCRWLGIGFIVSMTAMRRPVQPAQPLKEELRVDRPSRSLRPDASR